MILTIIKTKRLNPTRPLAIVKTLYGNGVKPAKNKIPSQAKKPAPSLKSFLILIIFSSYLYKLIISEAKSKKDDPMKYPKIPPNTQKIVAIKKILKNSFFLEKTIGVIITSGGIGKKELSINETSPKKNFELL